ncbi:MAG: hypothetical protein OT477_21920 [Chloroflexi bacterium]|nr:hypothetical protein [Chloroflexota bacterium]
MSATTNKSQWSIGKLLLPAIILFIVVQKFSAVGLAEQAILATSPIIIGELEIGNMWQLTNQGDFTYVAMDKSLVAINMANPAMPFEIDRLDIGEIIIDVTASNRHVYLGTPSGIWQINSENPAELQIVAHYDFDYVPFLTAKGDILYFISTSISSDTFYIADIHQINSFDIVGSSSIEQASQQDLDIIGNFVFVLQGYPTNQIVVINSANPSHPYITGYINSTSDRTAITHNYVLGIDVACSSVCNSFLGIRYLNWQTWETHFKHASIYSNSAASLAIEVDQIFVYVGKDVGLLVFNYHQETTSQSLPILAHYDVGNVNDIALTEEYILAATDRGFFVMPRPLIYTSHLPLVAHQGSFTD